MSPRGPKPGAGVSGGAEAGKLGGRPGNIVQAAYKMQQLTARTSNRARLTESERDIAIRCLQAALRDLEP
jgi:hypothetical protein